MSAHPDLPIDIPEHLIRVWHGGREKLWATPITTDLSSKANGQSQRWQHASRQHSRLHGARGWQGQFRYWHHHTPRPDSCAASLILRPVADDHITFTAPEDLAQLPHKDVFDCLRQGIATTCGELASCPLVGCHFIISNWQDSGSSASGVTTFAQLASAELIYAAYRQGDITYL